MAKLNYIENGVISLRHNGKIETCLPLLTPPCKILHSANNPQCIALSISNATAGDLGEAMDRIEDPAQAHARHILINRDGKLLQGALLTDSLKCLPINVSIDDFIVSNDNTISIELINYGRLAPYKNMYISAFDDILKRHFVRQFKDRYYEQIYNAQMATLSLVIGLICASYPIERIFDLGVVPGCFDYRLGHNYPHNFNRFCLARSQRIRDNS